MDRTHSTVVLLVGYAEWVWSTQLYLSLEDLSIDMIIGAVLPSLNSSAIDMRRKSKVFVSRRADLHTITVTQRDRQIN